MPLTKAQQLAADLAEVLDASTLSTDEKIKALGVVRSHVVRPSASSTLDEWRRERAALGPVGNSKKSEEMRSELAKQKKSPAGRK